MSDKNQLINNKDDHFSRLVKQKLENHQIPVSDDMWAGIEQKLAEKPKQRRLTPWYWLAGGVAAAVALLLLLGPVNDIPQATPSISSTYEQSNDAGPEPSVTEEEPASDSAVTDYENNPQSIPAEPEKAAGLISRKSNKKTLHANNDIDTYHPRSADEKKQGLSEAGNTSGSYNSSGSTETVSPPDKSAENTEYAAKTQTATNKTEKIDKLPDLNDYPVIPEQPRKARKKQKMLLAAAFGTGGNISSSSAAFDNEPPQKMLKAPGRQLVNSEVAKSYSGILDAGDYSKAQHHAPISAGVMVEMPLTERLGVESGLVYTYLKSVYKDPGSVEKNGSLQLHYLGIPLNMRIKALKKPKWNVYVAAGTMVEKGLRSYYYQEVENSLLNKQTEVKSNIDGLQWSLNGAVGVDYKLNKDLSLFVEPKLTYYMENNQPESARTEQPLNLGINGGLRIEL